MAHAARLALGLTCGRRWRGELLSCAAREPVSDEAAASASGALPRIAGYELERVLGAGGHGAVLRARRQADRLACAIQMARADAASGARRLRSGLRVLEAVTPPNVPQLFETLEQDGALCLVCELIAGASTRRAPGGARRAAARSELQAIAGALLRAVEPFTLPSWGDKTSPPDPQRPS